MLSSFIPPTDSEMIELNFSGVEVVAPSWLDEVLTLLRDRYGKRVVCMQSEHLSLQESLKIIEALDDQK